MNRLLVDLRTEYIRLDRRARRFKTVHIASRTFILLVGVGTVAVQALRTEFADLPMMTRPWVAGVAGTDVLQLAVQVLTGTASLVTAVTGWVNAPRQWVAARTGAEALRAEAFQYTTGAGSYRGDRDDAVLKARLLEIEEQVAMLDGSEDEGV